MRRVVAATITSLVITGTGLIPALADETSVATGSETTQETSSAATEKKAKVHKVKAKKSAATKEIAENTKDDKGDSAKSDSDAPKSTKKAAKASSSKTKSDTCIATRMASFLVCAPIGIPIAMVRKSKAEIVVATKDLVGDTDNKFLLAAGAPFGVPAGMVSGIFQGVFFGFWDAYKYSGKDPFGPTSFSFADDK